MPATTKVDELYAIKKDFLIVLIQQYEYLNQLHVDLMARQVVFVVYDKFHNYKNNQTNSSKFGTTLNQRVGRALGIIGTAASNNFYELRS